MRIALFIAVLITTSATAEPIQWTTSARGGSTIEIPEFMTESARGLIRSGEEEPYGTVYEPEGYLITRRQYYMASTGRPYRYISKAVGDIKPTYKIDKPNLGVISGQIFGGEEIFYGMCKKVDRLYCVDVFYPQKKQEKYRPIVERIAKSFKKCSSGCL